MCPSESPFLLSKLLLVPMDEMSFLSNLLHLSSLYSKSTTKKKNELEMGKVLVSCLDGFVC